MDDIGLLCSLEESAEGTHSSWVREPTTLSREVKAFLPEHHFVPDEAFTFPSRLERKSAEHVSKRFFSATVAPKVHAAWLVYSPARNGGFCLPCLLFASEKGVSMGGPLYNIDR